MFFQDYLIDILTFLMLFAAMVCAGYICFIDRNAGFFGHLAKRAWHYVSKTLWNVPIYIFLAGSVVIICAGAALMGIVFCAALVVAIPAIIINQLRKAYRAYKQGKKDVKA